MTDTERDQIAEETRRALVAAAISAWEDAGFQGLCVEGRWEAAIGAMQTLRLPAPRPTSREAASPRL